MNLAAFLRSPLARLVLRPAYDRVAVPVVANMYFPLSRAWAAAMAAGGDAAHLAAALPAFRRRPRAAARALHRLAPRVRAYQEAVRRWESAFFGDPEPHGLDLADVERDRALAAQALMLGRLCFLGRYFSGGIPSVGWAIGDHDAVARRHGPRLSEPARAFPVPAAGISFDRSREIPGAEFRTHWLRGAGEVGGAPDTVWARVERPLGDGPHPTLVFTHGICMETEFWHEEGGPSQTLAASGIAVVRPEGPYHGRRRREGFFGGEPVFAFGPMGMLNYFESHVRELGQLIAWARAEFGGPVAVGGVSLGALTVQLVLCAAAHWPAPMRPDAALLVTGGASVLDVVLEGSLARALGAPQALAKEGWTRDRLEPWTPLLQPTWPPALPGHKIVTVLGRRDSLTPYPGGEALARTWQVPAPNLFELELGHFTASLSLYRDAAPFDRLRTVLSKT